VFLGAILSVVVVVVTVFRCGIRGFGAGGSGGTGWGGLDQSGRGKQVFHSIRYKLNH
jgi:hypothetical protein